MLLDVPPRGAPSVAVAVDSALHALGSCLDGRVSARSECAAPSWLPYASISVALLLLSQAMNLLHLVEY
jgi:hypothetical protein